MSKVQRRSNPKNKMTKPCRVERNVKKYSVIKIQFKTSTIMKVIDKRDDRK